MAEMNKQQILQLVKLGLSEQEAQIYLLLLREGPLTAKSISSHLKILPNAVYRTARKLSEKGLVSISNSSPKVFHAISPSISLLSFAKNQALAIQRQAEQFIEYLHSPPKNPTQIRVIFGKEPTYLTTARLVSKLKKEGLFISIGEPISQDLLLAIKKATNRGVKIRLIVHKYDQTNKEIIENFKKNGIEVRHYPDWGFHLGVFDGTAVLLVVNNPQQTNERIGILIKSQGLAKAMRDYFYSVWDKATEV